MSKAGVPASRAMVSVSFARHPHATSLSARPRQSPILGGFAQLSGRAQGRGRLLFRRARLASHVSRVVSSVGFGCESDYPYGYYET